jgi:hypothetical protein
LTTKKDRKRTGIILDDWQENGKGQAWKTRQKTRQRTGIILDDRRREL